MIDTLEKPQERVDLSILEDVWSETHCESTHVSKENRTCTHQVVAVIHYGCDTETLRACAGQVRYTQWVREHGNACSECYARARDCWTVVPL